MANWEDILEEISVEQQRSAKAFDTVRRKYLLKLHEATGRNVIAYYSGWQSKPGISGTEIRDEDKSGFMRAIHEIDCSKGLDLILHTPGGSIAATQSIVTYLHEKFGRDIRAFIPHMAMSSGTIMACACKEIYMAKHSSIGPVDPQIRGMPATGVLEEFKKAYEEIYDPKTKTIDIGKEAIWKPILSQYPPTFLGHCRNAIDWSEEFAREQLANNMFFRSKKKAEKISKIIRELTHFDKVKTHERQINYKEARKMGLKIKLLEDNQDLQNLVLTVHHCFTYTLSNTAAFKIIENHNGAAFIKMAAPG